MEKGNIGRAMGGIKEFRTSWREGRGVAKGSLLPYFVSSDN